MSTFSTIAHAFRVHLRTAGHAVPLGHCQQVIAAALGFNSLAAYQASTLYSSDLQTIGHLVIDKPFILGRANELGSFPGADTSLQALIASLNTPELPVSIHTSLSQFQDLLQHKLEQFVQEDSDAVGAMSLANHDGIDEIYLPFELEDELDGTDNEISIDIEGHIGLGIDIERPYSGHKVNVAATITMERLSSSTFSLVDYYVENASLDYGWSDDESDEGEPKQISLAQALADELGITVEEAEELVDADCTTNESDDGLVYSYIFDFEPLATEPLRSKLLEEHGSLQIEVDQNFFDNIQPDFY